MFTKSDFDTGVLGVLNVDLPTIIYDPTRDEFVVVNIFHPASCHLPTFTVRRCFREGGLPLCSFRNKAMTWIRKGYFVLWLRCGR